MQHILKQKSVVSSIDEMVEAQTKQTETQTDETWKQELNNYRQRLE